MSEFKTSLTHPLVVNEVVVPGTAGRIGMTLCPGRSDDQSIYGNRWRRDLIIDLEAIRRLEPEMLITLNQPFEFKALGVPDFQATVGASGLKWRHLPIPDGGVPGPDFEREWLKVGKEARHALRAGHLVVIHCRAGLGRTGMIAARLLVELGTAPKAAIAAVRGARPNAIETADQERHVQETVEIDPATETATGAEVHLDERSLRGSVQVGKDVFLVFVSPDKARADVYKSGLVDADSLAKAVEALSARLPSADVIIRLVPPAASILSESRSSVDLVEDYCRTLKEALIALGVNRSAVAAMDEGGMGSEFRGFLLNAGSHAEQLLAARTLLGDRHTGTALPDLDDREHLAHTIAFTTRAISFSMRDGLVSFESTVARSLNDLRSAVDSFGQ